MGEQLNNGSREALPDPGKLEVVQPILQTAFRDPHCFDCLDQCLHHIWRDADPSLENAALHDPYLRDESKDLLATCGHWPGPVEVHQARSRRDFAFQTNFLRTDRLLGGGHLHR